MSKYIEVLLEGGSRSGKTAIIVYAIFVRAIKYPNTDHLSVRAAFTDVKQALWLKTIPDVHKMCFPNLQLKFNKTDHYITFPNGSRYFLGGLDNKERMEKILGNEYATIHENEISQTAFKAHELLKSRLNPPRGIKPLHLMDHNPASKRHWGYKLFHQFVNPLDDKPINYRSRLASLLMNPVDNLDNLSETYMDTLETFSQREKDRFMYGKYGDVTGAIYDRFTEKMIIDKDYECDYYVVGVDLITYAAVLVGYCSDDVIVIDELGGKDLTASECNQLIVDKWKKYHYTAYIDWNLSETGTREFDNSKLAIKGAGSVEAGINQVRTLMEKGHFYIHARCYRTITEIEEYHRDDNGKIVKGEDHFCVTGDTIINTVDGDYKIVDLVGKEGEVYCYNEVDKQQTVKPFNNVCLTKSNAEIIKITVEDDRVIRCTKDHPVLTDRGWIRADELKINDDILDINTNL